MQRTWPPVEGSHCSGGLWLHTEWYGCLSSLLPTPFPTTSLPLKVTYSTISLPFPPPPPFQKRGGGDFSLLPSHSLSLSPSLTHSLTHSLNLTPLPPLPPPALRGLDKRHPGRPSPPGPYQALHLWPCPCREVCHERISQ